MANRITELTSDLARAVLRNRKLADEKYKYRNLYHMAEAKVLSRDALLEQLSEEQLAQDLAKAESQNAELLEALEEIHNKEGQVCENYGACSHLVCKSSYTAWVIADEAIHKAKEK